MSNRLVPCVCRLWGLFALIAGISLAAAASRCEAEIVGDIEVTLQPLPSVEGGSGRHYGISHGYVEYRVQLKNRDQKDHIVSLIFPEELPANRMPEGVVTTRAVEVAAGQEVSVSFYQPFCNSSRYTMTVRVDGQKEDGVVRVGNILGFSYNELGCPAVLASRNIPRDFRDRTSASDDELFGLLGTIVDAVTKPEPASPPSDPSVAVAVSPPPEAGMTPPAIPPSPRGARSSSSEREPFTLLRSESPVSQWSPNWLGYTPYDAILLTQQEAEEMPAEAQAAIRRYLESGGVMVVHGRSVPAVFSQGGASDGKKGFYVGLGYVMASAPTRDDDWDTTHRELAHAPLHIYRPIDKPGNLHELLLAEAPVPVRGLFVLVLLFGLGIGPLNVWLLSIYKRRIWLWWNVPVISLVTCVLIFGYAAFSDGFTARGKVASLTFLDERCHRATTIGHLSYYCPLTPSNGLHFGTDTEVSLLQNVVDYHGGRGHSSRMETNQRRIDWTNQQHLVSGWVAARVPAYLQVRKNEGRLERLTFEQQDDGSLAVVNALGESVSRLYYADASGRLFVVQDVPAGARRTLSAVEGQAKVSGRGQAGLRQVFTSPDWLARFRDWVDMKDYSTLLTPGTYVAFLKKSPFIETPLARVESLDSAAIVYGICKETDHGR